MPAEAWEYLRGAGLVALVCLMVLPWVLGKDEN